MENHTVASALSPSKSRTKRAGVTPFILLSTPRSGTSWVMERLAAHPRIGSYGELLLDREGWPSWPPGAHDRPVYKTYLRDRGHLHSTWARQRHLFQYLDYVFSPRRGYEAIGFKMMYDQATGHPGVLPYIRLRGLRILHLVRTNLLDIALSQIALTLRSSSHAWSPGQREDLKVVVDTTELLGMLVRLERRGPCARAILNLLGAPTMELDYEALRASDEPWRATLRFLSVGDQPSDLLQATMLKLAPDSQREGVANFDEVEACLGGTRFARFLRP